jgi:polyferredoxin
MREFVCSQQCPQSIYASFILTEIEQQGLKKTMKKKKLRNEQPQILAYTLILQTMCSLFSCFFFFGSDELVFPPK